jgi:protein-disulfide isomerase
MLKRLILMWLGIALLTLSAVHPGLAQEDKIAQAAIETVRIQMRVPKDMEIKFIEKKESVILDFYAVKLLLMAPDREMPVLIYVDKTGEKVIVGSLFVKGENVTRKEAGEPKARKIDMALLDIDKSPARGAANAKMTVVEFSNFQCPYCLRAWTKMKEILEKSPKDVKYVFKHFPLQAQGKAFEFSEMAAAVQEVSPEAFWVIHDFLFSNEGQALLKGEKDPVKKKIEEILKGKGYDVAAFQSALESGKGKKRVEDDLAAGRKINVRGTPTTIVNGDLVRAPLTDKVVEQYLAK